MVFLVFFNKKMVYFNDFHLIFKKRLFVVWRWHTHEKKENCPCIRTIILKKYLRTKAQPHSSTKAHNTRENWGNRHAFCQVCVCAFVCKYFFSVMIGMYGRFPWFSWVWHFHTTGRSAHDQGSILEMELSKIHVFF